jgi:glycosyltransferase involved in cell wall biosynthesis
LVDLFICPSHFIEDKLNQTDLFLGKTLTIHNFIELKNTEEYDHKEEYVLYFGRLSEEKGIEMFLNSCKKLSHIKFKIAGTGPLDRMCMGIPNVEFVGFKTGEELSKLIKNAKFSVYPSIWYENCPLSILESESLGTPVIASKMGGIPELIENNETGILIEDISVDKLAKQINELYPNNERIKRMSKNCIDKREKMISLETYGGKLVELYQQYLRKASN